MERVQLSVGGLTFNHQFPRHPRFSLDWSLQVERLRHFFSHLMVLNLGSLVWLTWTLSIRPFLHKLYKLLLVTFFCLNWAILQIYCTHMKYTLSIILKIFWFPKFVNFVKKLKNNLNLYVSSILWVHQQFCNKAYFKYTLNLFLKCICISCRIQKYTWSRLSKLMSLLSDSEVYLR